MKKKVFAVIIVLLIIIQFFPISTENPSFIPENDFVSLSSNEGSKEGLLIKDACYDCHSHQTVFPNYTRLQPLGFFLRSHVRGGRQKLNFSTWSTYTPKQQNHKLQECVEVLEENRMPMKSYTWLHPKSRLSDEDKAGLKAFFDKSQNQAN